MVIIMLCGKREHGRATEIRETFHTQNARKDPKNGS
nr:MAG TPA: hypothetical protein [Caudoviricetes sp.]